MPPFSINPAYTPVADQPKARDELARGLNEGDRFQTLLGVTGSGKTATMAFTIEQVQRPALVIAHNKTLAAQLCNEFREFLTYYPTHRRADYAQFKLGMTSFYQMHGPERDQTETRDGGESIVTGGIWIPSQHGTLAIRNPSSAT